VWHFSVDSLTSRMPRADWIAFICAAAILCLAYAWPPVQSFAALAIFAPAVLRDINVLRDGGQRARDAAYRAGFHAFVLLVAMFLISHILVRCGVIVEDIGSRTPILSESYLRGLLVAAYLVSYVLQMFGPRDGSFAILLGAALMSLAPVPAILMGQRSAGFVPAGVIVLAAIAAVMVTAACAARSWPRPVGWALSATFMVGVVVIPILGRGSLPAEAQISALVQLGLAFGSTGLALLKREHGAHCS
jgi:hypothetical protein